MNSVKFAGNGEASRPIILQDPQGYKRASAAWHKSAQAAQRAFDDVSVPGGGDWGNVLGNPDWHVKAYDKAIDIMGDVKKLTAEGTPLMAAVDKAIDELKSNKSKVEKVVRKFRGELNDSNSEGWHSVQYLHGMAKRALKEMFMARYDESIASVSGLSSMMESATRAIVTEGEFDGESDEDAASAESSISDDLLEAILVMMAGTANIADAGPGESGNFIGDLDEQGMADALLYVAREMLKSKGRFKQIARGVKRNPSSAIRSAIEAAKAAK